MNSPQNLDIKEFFTPGKTLEKAHVILHLAEPSAPHEKERGFLFVLIELTTGTSALISSCQEIIQYIESRYYSREEKNEYLLERILQAVNREYRETLANNPDITCLVGTLLEDGSVTISHHGLPQAAVLYWHNSNLQTYPIITENSLDPDNFFSDLISGTINNHDFFYIATPHVGDYFPLDRVTKLLTDRPVREVSSHLQKVLTEIGSDYSFGGIVAQLNQKPVVKLAPQKAGSAASLNHLVTAADRTAETLSPPLIKDVKNTLTKIREKTRELPLSSSPFARAKRRQWGQTPPENFLQSLGKMLVEASQGVLKIIVSLGLGIYHSGGSVYRLCKNKHSRLDEINRWRERFDYYQRTLKSLPPISKAIVAALSITSVLFLGTLAYRTYYLAAVERTETIKNLSSAITDKANAAEASLAYDDKAKASLLVNEAYALVRQIQETDDHYAGLSDLQKQLQSVTDHIRNEHRLDTELVADFSQVNNNSQTTQLTGYKDTLIAYGPSDPNWYFVTIGGKEVVARKHEAIAQLSRASVNSDNDFIVFGSPTGDMGVFDADTQTLAQKLISFPVANTKVDAFAVYNSKLYTIDATNKKIYRHNLTPSGFDQGSPWLKSGDTRLNGAIDLAIDGDLYVLKDNGEVRKWYRGDEQGFSLAPIEPALTTANMIITPAESNELFILDTENKRIVVFDKSGAFKEQLKADAWKNPSSFWVDKTGKTIFVLDGQTILRSSR